MKEQAKSVKAKETAIVRPELANIQQELAIRFAALGVLLNEMYRPGSGTQLFGFAEDSPSALSAQIDVSRTIIGRYLPVFYAYAYDGRVLPGLEEIVAPDNGSPAELLSDFVELFGRPTGYMGLAHDAASEGLGPVPFGGLQDLVDRLHARHFLDRQFSMSISDIALLANMNERSVRNATTASGKNHLPLNASGEVDYHVAIQWLSERAGRGFVPTRRVTFPADGVESEVQLEAIEIPAFIRERLTARFGAAVAQEWEDDMAACSNYTEVRPQRARLFERAAALAMLTPEQVADATRFPLAIPPGHCAGLARAIGVDPSWFTLQVMRGLYPTEMDMVLNPAHYRLPGEDAGAAAVDAIEIVLTESMIKHGYLDLPASAKAMFPEDCFGAATGSARAETVRIHYGASHCIETDMRIKSEKTISPRKRFTAWLQSELGALPGDRVRIERKDAREYALRFHPVRRASTQEDAA